MKNIRKTMNFRSFAANLANVTGLLKQVKIISLRQCFYLKNLASVKTAWA